MNPWTQALRAMSAEQAQAILSALDQYVENCRESVEIGDPVPDLHSAEEALEILNAVRAKLAES